jgi:hypothetical protein
LSQWKREESAKLDTLFLLIVFKNLITNFIRGVKLKPPQLINRATSIIRQGGYDG